MTWKINFTISAENEFAKLPHEIKISIRKYLVHKVQINPRECGKPMVASAKIKLWRYRVQNYRLITQIKDQEVSVLVVKIGKRDSVYQK